MMATATPASSHRAARPRLASMLGRLAAALVATGCASAPATVASTATAAPGGSGDAATYERSLMAARAHPIARPAPRPEYPDQAPPGIEPRVPPPLPRSSAPLSAQAQPGSADPQPDTEATPGRTDKALSPAEGDSATVDPTTVEATAAPPTALPAPIPRSPMLAPADSDRVGPVAATATTQAQALAVAPEAPPPARYEQQPPTNVPGHVWVPGYWNYYGPGAWSWIGGGWLPARAGYVYVGPRWVLHRGGFRFLAGGWAWPGSGFVRYPVFGPPLRRPWAQRRSPWRRRPAGVAARRANRTQTRATTPRGRGRKIERRVNRPSVRVRRSNRGSQVNRSRRSRARSTLRR